MQLEALAVTQTTSVDLLRHHLAFLLNKCARPVAMYKGDGDEDTGAHARLFYARVR